MQSIASPTLKNLMELRWGEDAPSHALAVFHQFGAGVGKLLRQIGAGREGGTLPPGGVWPGGLPLPGGPPPRGELPEPGGPPA